MKPLQIFAQNFNTNCPSLEPLGGAKILPKSSMPLSRAHEGYRQTTARRQRQTTDGRLMP